MGRPGPTLAAAHIDARPTSTHSETRAGHRPSLPSMIKGSRAASSGGVATLRTAVAGCAYQCLA
jgi:hypothetical protein